MEDLPRAQTYMGSTARSTCSLEELAASGMHLDRQRAGGLITGQVRAVAALMRVTEATARSYLGDEIIKARS